MRAGVDLVVTDDPAEEAAERLMEAAQAGGHLALAGGSTPRRAYERAADMGGGWSETTLWFGDERCVGPGDEHSNFAMVSESLLDRLEGPQPAVERIRGEDGPDDGARDYEERLRDVFGEGVPVLNLVLLGLGPDAHTASLFPSDEALTVDDRLATGVETPGMDPLVARITLTLPVINAARQVVFLVSGADKAPAVARAFGGAADPSAPASLVSPTSGSLTLIVDEDAAEGLDP